MIKRAIFLDRDGTINNDSGYTHKISEWRWLAGALTGLRLFSQKNWTLVVVSNQSGIGRGYYAMKDVLTLENWLNWELERLNIKIAAWKYCPHAPEANCQCRKPSPLLLLEAAREIDIALDKSWMLGDKISDIEAGIAAGCHVGLIANSALPDEEIKAKALFPNLPVWKNLREAAENIA